MKCPYCGEKIKRDSNVCDYCGGKIEIDIFSADQKENSEKNDRIPWFYQMWFISIVFWVGSLFFGLGPIIATVLFIIRIVKYSQGRKLAIISGSIQAVVQGGMLLVLLLLTILAACAPVPSVNNSASENSNQTDATIISDGNASEEENEIMEAEYVEEDDWYMESTEIIDENNNEPEKPLAEGEEISYEVMQKIRANALDYSFSGDIGKTKHCSAAYRDGNVTLKEVFLIDEPFVYMWYDSGMDEWCSAYEQGDGLYLAVTFETENTIPLANISGYYLCNESDFATDMWDPQYGLIKGASDCLHSEHSDFLRYEDGSWEIMAFYRIGTYNKNTNSIEIETFPDMFVFGDRYETVEFSFSISGDASLPSANAGDDNKETAEEYESESFRDWSGDYVGGWMDTFLELTLESSLAADGSCGTMSTSFRGMSCYWALDYIGDGCLYASFCSGDYEESDYYVQMKYDSSDNSKYIDMWTVDGTESVTFYKD